MRFSLRVIFFVSVFLLLIPFINISVHAQNYGLPSSEQAAHLAALQQALAQVENEKTVTVNGTNFTLNYTITGNDNKIAKINLDTAGKELVIFMNAHGYGNFTITLPRELIDARINGTDNMFTYHDIGGDITAFTMGKKNTSVDRTITIFFGKGNEVIGLDGSHVIPEFSFLLSMILPISITGMILIYSCFRSSESHDL